VAFLNESVKYPRHFLYFFISLIENMRESIVFILIPSDRDVFGVSTA